MNAQPEIAVVGATHLIGETLIQLLHERGHAIERLHALDTGDAVGERVAVGEERLAVSDAEAFDFATTPLVFTAGDPETARRLGEQAAEAGSRVVDLSGAWQDDPDVPLVIPEVNPEELDAIRYRGIVACPDCHTILLWLTLNPLRAHFGLRQIFVTAFRAVSRQGKAGIEELAKQTADLLNVRPIEPQQFRQQIAFNVLARTGDILQGGYSSDELRLVEESRRLLPHLELDMMVTTVQMPVFFGDALQVYVTLDVPVDVDSLRAILAETPGIDYLEATPEEAEPSPVTDAAGSDAVYVTRLRMDLNRGDVFGAWILGDCTRKGSALNAVQIAEILVKDYL